MKTNTVYLNMIKNKGNQINNVNILLFHEKLDEFPKIVRYIKRNQFTRNLLNKRLFPVKIDLGDTFFSSELSFERLLYLSSCLVSSHCDEINEFIMLKKQFESNFLLNESVKADEILQKVENKYGQSLWLIESRQLLSVMDNNSNYKPEGIIDFLDVYLDLLSIKNNPEIKDKYYSEIMDNTINTITKSNILKEFFKYKLFVTRVNLDWKVLLSFFLKLSLIDIYLLIIDVLQEANDYIINDRMHHLFDYLNQIDDEKLLLIRDRFNSKEYIVHNEKLLVRLNDFESTKESIIQEFDDNKEEYVNCINTYFLISVYNLNSVRKYDFGDCLANQLLENICVIKEKNDIELIIDSLNNIYKFSRMLNSFSIGTELLIFFSEYINVDNQLGNMTVHNSYLDIDLYLGINFSDSLLLLPERKDRSLFSEKLTDAFLEWFSKKNKDEIAYNYYNELFIFYSINKKIKNGQVLEAIHFYVETFIHNEILVLSIDIRELNSFISKRIKENLILTLEEIFFLYINNKDGRFKTALFNALDDPNYPLQNPIEYIERNTSEKLIKDYFLFEICDLNCLKEMYWLEDTFDGFINRRIGILHYLLESNTDIDSKTISNEIEELTKRQIINNRIRIIDSSRISIDMIKIWENVVEKETYYLSRFNSTDISAQAYFDFDFDFENRKPITQIPARIMILRQMYRIFIKSFCYSDFGIDSSISTRIRHGAFYNQIIRVFMTNGLVPNDSPDNFFSKLVKSGKLDKSVFQKLQMLYAHIKEILEYSINNQFKVIVEEYIEGAIFDYSFNSLDEQEIELLANIEHLLPEELFSCFQKLAVIKTNHFLQSIRNSTLKDILTELSKSLEIFKNETYTLILKDTSKTKSEINRKIIDCNLELQKEIETINKWFYLSKTNDFDNYSFNVLLDTVNGINEKLFTNYSVITISQNEIPAVIKGDSFQIFVDIYLILFNNAITHSGYFDDLKELNISITISEADNICIIFSNNLKLNNDNRKMIDDKISELNCVFTEEKYRDINTMQEGGMGLYKVMHMLFLKNQYGEGITFYRSDNLFNVKIELRKDILANDENSVS